MPKFLSDGIFDGSSTDLIVDGKIGIGITPSAKLTVSNPSDYEIVLETGTASHGKLAIGHFSNGSMITTFGNDGGSGDLIRFGTHTGDERMRITSGGDIGINETNPSQKLHVDGGIRITGAYYDSNNSPGTSGQVLSSTATGTDWIDQGDIVASEADKAKSVILRVKNSTATAMSKGQVVCEAVSATPPNGNLIEVALADNNGTNTMPALGILNEDLDAAGGANDEGDAIMFGKVSGINTSAFSVGDEVFVDDTPGGLTTTKPTGVKYIQKVGVVIRDDASNGTIEVFGAGRVNDVPTPLYIDHANQRLGIVETSPDAKLHIDAPTGDFLKITESGADRLTLDSNGEMVLTPPSNWGSYFKVGKNVGPYEVAIELGEGRTANNNARIDFIGDTTYTDYGFRIIRGNGGANTTSQLVHRGTGNFELVSTDSGDIILNPNDGNVGIGTTNPSEKLAVSGGNIEIADGNIAGRKIGFDVSDSISFNSTTIAQYGMSNAGNSEAGGITYSGFFGQKFFTNGSQRMVIERYGDVGINETNPSQRLHVNGNARVTGAYYDSNNSPGTSNQILSSTASGTDWISIENLGTFLDIIDVSESGNTTAEWSLIKTLPASTSSQRDTLFIKIVGGGWNDNMRFEAEITLSNRDSFNYFWDVKGGSEYFTGGNGGNRLRVVAYSQTDGTVDVYLYKASYMTGYIYATFQNTGAPEIITSLGSPVTTQPSGTEVFSTYGNTYPANIAAVNDKVGIGTTSPGAKLDVVSGDIRLGTNATYFRVRDTASAQPRVLGINSANTFYIGPIDSYAGGAIAYGVSGNVSYHGFYGGGSEKVRITSSGNVGIGTTSPQSKLQVSASGNETTLMVGASGTLSDKSSRIFLNEGENGVTDSKDYGFSLAYDGNSSAQYGLSSNQFGIIRHDNSATGSAVMRINRSSNDAFFSGNVGVGMTTSPAEKLHVYNGSAYITPIAYAANQNDWVIRAGAYNNTSFDQGLKLKSSSGGVSYMAFETAHSGGETMVLNSGQVGIGTDSPGAKLTVVDDILLTGSSPSLTLTDATSSFVIKTNTAGEGIVQTSGTSKPIRFFRNNGANESMRIDGAGNVGIGITNLEASAALTLHRNDVDLEFSVDYAVADTARILSYDRTANTHRDLQLRGENLTFYANSNERMRITSGGDVGIGTNGNPHSGFKLHVAGHSKIEGVLYVNNTSASDATDIDNLSSSFSILNGDSSDHSPGLDFARASNLTQIIQGNYSPDGNQGLPISLNPYGGNVGINTTSPSKKLEVDGDVLVHDNLYIYNTSNYLDLFFGRLDVQFQSGINVRYGTTYKPVYASAFTVSSDYRLKSNIVPLENAISRVNQLEVHRFNWNDRLDEPKVDGFIAHEVSSVVPEAVLGEKDATHPDGTPDYQGIDQAKLVPLLTAALQEAITKIENLESRIQTLENQ